MPPAPAPPTFDILTLASEGRAEDVWRSTRVRALYSPFYFSKVVLGYTKLTTSLHLPELELFASRWSRGYNRQVVQWPRAFYKSTSFTISCAIWGALPVSPKDHAFAQRLFTGPTLDEWNRRAALHDQNVLQVIAFETEANAIKKGREIRWHYERNEFFRSLFPEIAYTGKESSWTDKSLKQRRVGERERSDEGTFEFIGVGGALQSRHFDRMWLDDLVGKAARDSQAVMSATLEWFDLLYGNFVSAKIRDQTRFVIGNRWAFNDLNSHIAERQPDVAFYTRAAVEIDENGVEYASCPEILDLEDISRLRREMSTVDFSCQYLNNPISSDQADLTADHLHTYTVSNGTLTCSCGDTAHINSCRRYMHYDPYTAKATSTSRPALVVTAVSPTSHVYILHTYMRRETYSAIFDNIFDLADRWRVDSFTYEDVGAQNMTEFYIRQRARASKTHFPPITALKVGGKSKETRIRDYLFPVIRAGRMSVHPSNAIIGSMLAAFPSHSFDHDYDILDALAQGATVWRAPLSSEATEAIRTSDAAALAALSTPYTYWTPPTPELTQGALVT